MKVWLINEDKQYQFENVWQLSQIFGLTVPTRVPVCWAAAEFAQEQC